MKVDLQSYCDSTALVTGASGYVGSLLVKELSKVGCHAIRASRSSAKADFASPAFWRSYLDDGTVDFIFHLAAQTNHYVSNQNPAQDFDSNVRPLVNLIELLKTRDRQPRIIFASTVTVYGCPTTLPVDESTMPNPLTTYDVHKLACENELKQARSHGISGLSLRLANVYGKSEAESREGRGILNLMAKKALQGENLKVFGTGEWLRDFVHVSDVVNAFLMAGLADSKAPQTEFNICTGRSLTFNAVVRMLADEAEKRTGRKVEIAHDLSWTPPSPIDVRNFAAKPKAFADLTGWKPIVDFETGLRNFIKDLAI